MSLFGTVFKNSFFVLLLCKNKKKLLESYLMIVFKNYFQKIIFEKCNQKTKNRKQDLGIFNFFSCSVKNTENIRKYNKNN